MPDEQLFRSIAYTASRKNPVLISIGVHIVLLSVAIIIPLFILSPANPGQYYSVPLVPPAPRDEVLEVTQWKPLVLPRQKPAQTVVQPATFPPELARAEVKPPELPKSRPEELKLPEIPVRPKPTLLTESNLEYARPEPPKPEIKTNVFSEAAVTKPTVNLPANRVQTGGFGDPNGIKGEGRPDWAGNIAALGSFDLPLGPGAGNGGRGATGVKGVVAGAGFANAVTPNHSGTGGRSAVQPGGFGDVDSPASVPQARKREIEAPQTAVEITFKPTPAYTDEARRLRIQGEVLVRVLFTATGQVKVLGIERSLGHGLDQNAIRAAEQIRFKPASRGGTPVDSSAIVHIVFQLAN